MQKKRGGHFKQKGQEVQGPFGQASNKATTFRTQDQNTDHGQKDRNHRRPESKNLRP